MSSNKKPIHTRKCSAKYFRNYHIEKSVKNIVSKQIRGYVFPDNPDMIYESTKYNEMSDKPIKIDKKWTLSKKSNRFINEFYCGNRVYATKKKFAPHLKNYKTWRILDNGGNPFIVFTNEKTNKAEIYGWPKNAMTPEGEEYSDENEYYSVKIGAYNCKKIFIGKSPLTKMTHFSGGYGPRFDGNTILLDMGNKRYIAICQDITEFTTSTEIIEYVSEVGNSSVPYPYAIDANGNVYLIIEKVMVKYCDVQSFETAYQDYYKKKTIGKKFKNLKYIMKRDV